MSDAPRPTLKLKFGKKPAEPPAEPAAPPAEPAQPKLTLKIGRKPQPETTEEKPKKKKSSTKKRPAENVAQPEPTTVQQGPKRLKLNPSKKPGLQSIRLKNKGVALTRPVGVGYDSEASDTEADPVIEEQFILRMLPGDDCEYLRQAINERRFDKSEFSFKPLNREGRRAILKIRDKQYAASLVDLPCIIEGMKSWDRRGWYKSADICQMLLVLGQVSSDQEALEFPLPPEVEHPDDKTIQYPHGLAPPLRWVRKRRFRDRVSSRTIEQVEKAVEDLIAQDEESVLSPRFELVDSTSLNRAEGYVQSGDYDDYYDEDQDAEGEAEEEMMDDFEDALAAEMEAALAADDDAANAPEQAETPSGKPSMPGGPPGAGADSSGDESDDSDEGGDVGEDDLDDEQLEQQRQLQQQREEVAELETLIRTETATWEKVQNHILRNKMGRRIQELKKDLALKKVSIGMPADGDD
ncbi:TAFII55 protein conserved region [Penicillium hispanicum]|uniref:TAFII55 protein conserved region n=1 Tax=Penicillium hispanicum TaxID=1080232 RepID=UPI00254062C1|nr:TAFII55 protein conserved region [Penicillium hispanicum]KAJ5591993.1 TAFII55 protein conserved region [Penicillium hispanicum]